MFKIFPKKSPITTRMQFNDIEIIIIKKPIKNMYLRIKRNGTVQLSVPLRCSAQAIQHFITLKQDWIKQHQALFLNRDDATLSFETGNLHPFLGQSYPIIIHEYTHPQRVIFEETHIACYLKQENNLEIKQKLFQIWHRNELQRLLPDLIRKWEPVIGVCVSAWGVKAMTSRWGSCNTQTGKIWLNLHLIHKPIQCLEYVVVHEMVHLLEASHNQRFYALMSTFLPKWREYKNLLRQS